MKKFLFRLQKVLDVRRIHERREQEVLQKAIRKRHEEEKRLELLEKEVEDIQRVMRENQQNVFEAWVHTADLRYRNRVENAKTVQTGRIHDASQQEEERRNIFTEARRQTRVLEKLRELRQSDWQRDASRYEDKLLDEIAAHTRNLRRTL
ncbi:flagellar export protein FliJ [bacterium]|nr:flagellar export protein FliJ [bacterium]